jgi:UrcA family protein
MTGETLNPNVLEMPMKAIASHRRRPMTAMLLLAGLTTLPLTAQSADTSAAPDERRSVQVSYADLNLAHPAGVQALYGRLKSAARQLCLHDYTSRELYRRAASRDCYDRTLDDAVDSVNDARLKGLHAANARRSAIG